MFNVRMVKYYDKRGKCSVSKEVPNTYLWFPASVVGIGAAGDEPEDQLFMIFVPRAMENLEAQLDAELDVLSVPELRPSLYFFVD